MVDATKFKTEKRYLSAKEDNELDGKKLIIEAVFNEDITDMNGRVKPALCIRLKDVKKVLSLNQTNLAVCMDAWGVDTDKWVNEKVVFKVVNVTFKGDVAKGIQIDPVI